MTGFPWLAAPDEIEHADPTGEPSHVHIPRPSRQRQGLIGETAFEEHALRPGGCACADN